VAAFARPIGRQPELAELHALLEEAMTGREQRVALVGGDPGMGKTTLLEGLAAEAGEAGVRTVWGRCWEGGGTPPYWPWIQVLRACVAAMRAQGAQLDADLAELGPLVPELAASGPPPAPPGHHDRSTLFQAVARLLGRAGGEGLIVALDDLHGADEGSLQLLRYLARQQTRAPLLIVGTYRVREVVASRPHQLALGAVAKHGPTMRLRGLSPDDVAVLLAASGAAVRGRAHEVHRVTDGNPFLVREAARLLAAGADTVLPAEARAVVAAHVEALDPALREVLAAAAVLGSEFPLGLLTAVAGMAGDDLLNVLARAEELQVIEAVGLGRWSFVHSLLRDSLLKAVDGARRRSLHARAAEILQAAYGDEAGAEVAYHFIEARDARAADAAARAARSAAAALAVEDAAAWYRKALDALAWAGGGQDRRRYDLLLRLGEASQAAGRPIEARDAYKRAIKAASALGSLELRTEAAVRCAPFAVSDPLVIGALDDALCDLPEGDSPLRASALVAFAHVLSASSVDRNKLRQVSLQGVEMARRVGDEETLWTVLSGWHANVLGMPGALQERLRVAEELVAIAARRRDPLHLLAARQAWAHDLFEAGRVDLARAEAEACIRTAGELRRPDARRPALVVLFEIALFEGRAHDAERLAREASDLARRAVDDDADLMFDMHFIALRRLEGRFDEVERLCREAMARWTVAGLDCGRQLALVVALGELGRFDEASSLLDHLVGDRAVEVTSGMIVPGVGWVAAPRLCCPSSLAEVCCLLGDTVRAELLYDHLLPHADAHVVVALTESRGVCARYLGQLAALLGRHDEADAHFQLAHLHHERLGTRLWGARGRLDHARMLLDRGDRRDLPRARELATAAREAFAAMGLSFWERRAAAVLDALPAQAGPDRARLCQEGEYWAFHYGGQVARLRDSKGLRYLARLLHAPGQELHALDLVAEGGSRGPGAGEPGLGGGAGDAGAVLDARAKAAYKARLDELREELEEATAHHDLGRAARAREEMDFLVAELSAAVGLGGRDRRAASDAERARQSVTRAVKGAIERLAEAHPSLGEHLRSTVRTGIYSAYVPDPRAPIVWER
jgi:hypothetical protein